MTNSNWKRFAKISLGLILIVIILAAGCSDLEKLNYNTNSNQQKILELKGKTLVILSFEYKDKVFLYAEHVEPSVAQIVADYQKDKFLSEFGSLFKIKDVSNDASALKGRKPSIDHPELASEILKEVGADGGILITNAYGYKMRSSLLEAILEKFLPKDLVGMIFGPSIVESFYFASNTYLVDTEGHIIWNFYGKASASPDPLEMIKPEQLVRGVVGLSPSNQTLVQAMASITNHYTEYLRWLVQADMDNLPNKNYFTAYPNEKRIRPIAVWPYDKSYPILSDEEK